MKKGFFIFALIWPGLLLAKQEMKSQDLEIHILKKGETLSELLYHQSFKPLYGENNWVQKVLELNHLNLEQARQIKKGYPIILPSKNENVAAQSDHVNLKQSSTIRYGLVGNRISDHQDIYIDVSYLETYSQVASYEIKQQSNLKLGVSYEDKSERRVDGLTYRPEFSFFGIGHGPAEFINKSDTTASFGPTLQAEARMMLGNKAIDFEFGPYAALLEKSHIDEIDNQIKTRRDRFVTFGATARRIYEHQNLIFVLNGSVGMTVLSENLTGSSNMQMLSSKMTADINLTKDYFLGVFWQNDQFSNTKIENANSLGLNLKYFVK